MKDEYEDALDLSDTEELSQKYGLDTVSYLGSDGGYDWAIIKVWKHTSGKFYWAHDSGCSCSYAFEGNHFRGPDDTDLSVLEPHTFKHLEESAEGMSNEYASKQEKVEFLAEIRRAMK